MPLILNTAAAASPLVVLASHHFSKFPIKHLGSSRNFKPLSFPSSASPPSRLRRMSWLGKLGLGFGGRGSATDASSAIAQGPDDDVPAAGQEFAQFGAGCFWSVELGFQRVPGVTKTEVGYSQGNLHEPTYEDVCTGMTNHNEVVRLQYDPRECKYEDLLDLFWERHDPTTPNRQVNSFEAPQNFFLLCIGIWYYPCFCCWIEFTGHASSRCYLSGNSSQFCVASTF
ncbi:hypothetical protein GW17_00014345 [Ensete ventricosum]|nr:hypothetical protein GW17_00014345 [Ensete ventricosum]